MADELPKFACLCCTFLRPSQLSNSVACFEALDYPLNRRELIILDDAGQYPQQPSGQGWQIISVKRRFATLGEKRNALSSFASSDVDAYAVWDDDDAYLPWTLQAHAWALSNGAECSAPSVILNEVHTEKRFAYHGAKGLFHAAWCFTRESFRSVGGYPWKSSGEDQCLGGALARRLTRTSDPTEVWPPYFVHRWSTSGSWHLSAFGSGGYEKLAVRLATEGVPVPARRPMLSCNWKELALQFLGALKVPISTILRAFGRRTRLKEFCLAMLGNDDYTRQRIMTPHTAFSSRTKLIGKAQSMLFSDVTPEVTA